MKKIKLMVVLVICLFICNVKADMGPPHVITYKAMITNKDGAVCYEDGKKTDKVIPYKTIFEVYDEVNNGYIYVHNDNYDCSVKSSDLSAINHDFDITSKEVVSISPIKAIILANGGLNMRSGPATSYAKIITIPQYTVVTLKLHAGTYWYYTEYNGHSGWITGMHGYFGVESSGVLISDKILNIYNSSGKVVGKIPANTEITDYVGLPTYYPNEYQYYVVYNGIKGYLDDNNVYIKIEPEGKIKLINDIDIKDSNGKPIKKLTKGQELVYDYQDFNTDQTMIGVHLKEKNTFVYIEKTDFEYIIEGKTKVKEKGYLGEGLFGEAKEERQEEPQEEVKEETQEKENFFDGLTEIQKMILGFVAGIIVALTIFVIARLVLKKKNSKQLNNYVANEDKPDIVMEKNDDFYKDDKE